MGGSDSAALLLLNALPDPVFVLDADDYFAEVNSAAEVFFSCSRAVLARRSFAEYCPPASPLQALVEQVRRSGMPVNEYRVDLASPRLTGERQVDVHVGPLADRERQVMVKLQPRSIADALDAQLTHRGSARSVSGLAAMLAHEIKNPLSGIRGAAQLLEHNATEDEATLTKLITDETDRIVRLVDRLEVFSNQRPIERESLNIHTVLDHVANVARSGFAKSVSLAEVYDPSLPNVLGNSDQLTQVFLNLVKNACEATVDVEHPTLTIVTSYRPGVRMAAPGSAARVSLPISLEIRDNGPGPDPAMREYLFDPFVSSKENGSGLGLALVAKIIGDHGGVVSCAREAGETVFRVLLPVSGKEKADA
ncbi:MAG: ATP-binding protein [Pseudomonadota bacterium]